MKLPIEILDRIFSFLVSHYTLDACSNDPVLSPIVDRHLYYRIHVYFGPGESTNRFFKLVFDNPCIFSYVRVLRISVSLDYYLDEDLAIKTALDEFSKTLLMFPRLECIELSTSRKRLFLWPSVFQAALEDRLSLPTVKELQVTGNQKFPYSLINNHNNIKRLLLGGDICEDDAGVCNSQLESLTLVDFIADSLLALVQPNIKELRSLKCTHFSVKNVSQLLGVCSQTLNTLDIDFHSSLYFSNFKHLTRMDQPMSELSPIPPHLQQLTIRTAVYVEDRISMILTGSRSYLPATAEILSLFASSTTVQHLILDIDMYLHRTYSHLAKVDFSPLAVLGVAARSIPRIDLYVHTDFLPSHVTLAQFLFSLEDCEDIARSIEEGILIIHPEKRFGKEDNNYYQTTF